MEALVSCIITTFKGSNFLKRAIESMLNQTYKNIEVIVVDDNSDGTEDRKLTQKVMDDYSKNGLVKYIKHEKNKNGSAARNTGIGVAIGKYVCFCDDDDFYLPTRIEKSVKKLEENPKYDAVFCGVIIAQEKSITGIRYVEVEGNCQIDLLKYTGLMGTGSNLFLTKKAVDKLVEFDESFIRHQDIEYMIRFYDYFKSININELLVVKAVNGTNNQPDINKFISVKEHFFKKFNYIMSNIDKKTHDEIMCIHYSELLSQAYKNLNFSEMLKLVKYIRPYRKLSLKEKLKIIVYGIEINGKKIYSGKRYNVAKNKLDKVTPNVYEYVIDLLNN